MPDSAHGRGAVMGAPHVLAAFLVAAESLERQTNETNNEGGRTA